MLISSAKALVTADELQIPLGKSASLNWLSRRLALAVVPPGRSIRVRCWRTHPMAELAALRSMLPEGPYAVRSDAACEDGLQESHAGRFLSLLEIDDAHLPLAIARVMASLPGHPDDGVLVQPMIGACRRVGVATTHRVDDGAPWYCIEASSGDTAAVTSGRATGRLLAWPRDKLVEGIPLDSPPDEQAVLSLVLEIECLLPGQAFEIEWALPAHGQPLQLLQWRPLASQRQWPLIEPKPLAVNRARCFIERDERLLGHRTVLSSMADWNPAELIGRHPRPLALDLFRDCISRGVWWRARSDLGYRSTPDPRVDLLTNVVGRPYVDVRRSANSLLPADLSDQLGTRLVDGWIEQLIAQPTLHDKVEFSVFCTARDLRSRRSWSTAFAPALGIDGARTFDDLLSSLTRPLMSIDLLDRAPTLTRIANGTLRIDEASPSLRTLTRRAAYEFAQLARIAFIAEAQLRSAMARGALDPQRVDALRRGDREPCYLMRNGEHLRALRPSSFDITQPLWQTDIRSSSVGAADHASALTQAEVRAISRLLNEARLPSDAHSWARWIGLATQAREWGKTAFNQPLGAWIEAIADRGAERGLDRETLSWLDLRQCQAVFSGRLSPAQACVQADRAQAQAQREHRHMMSPVLREPADLARFDSLDSEPNFIGQHSVRAPLQVLRDGNPDQQIVPGALIATAHADPGFDWLFDRQIGGLLTAWGGSHSHMGIRCAEHGLAAALGCGDAIWAKLQTASEAHLDPIAGALWLS